MANPTQFEQKTEGSSNCAVCEAMLPDAVDGLLSETEQRVFDQHVVGCVECARELAEARRGAAWLSMLKSKAPEPPSGMLERILAGTTGTANNPAPAFVPSMVSAAASQTPANASTSWGTRLAAFPRRLGSQIASQLGDIFSIEAARATFQPRLAMTAAMAFFSIALTLNLTGINLSSLRADRLTPSSLSRSVADASASATRSFQNMRVVYQVESRVSELTAQSSADAPRIDQNSPEGSR